VGQGEETLRRQIAARSEAEPPWWNVGVRIAA
jgi:hypothetical protein